MKTHVATIFDKNYIVRTLAFYDALRKVGPEYTFWFLCLDEETRGIMHKLNFPNVTLVTVEELNDQKLMATRKDRSAGEFAFTAKAVFVDYIARTIPEGEALIYADNDVIFLLPPNELLERMKNLHYSIGITLHRFPKERDHMNFEVGKYNAGLIFFIIDDNSRTCIREWKDLCVEWCYLINEPERFGDQKYITKWPQKYNGVYEIPDKGINTGSWNLSNWKITKRNAGNFMIDADPLICYHFHRIKFYESGEKIKPLPIYIFHDELYAIYTDMLQNAWKQMLVLDKNWKYGFVDRPSTLRLWKQHVTRLVRKLKGNISSED